MPDVFIRQCKSAHSLLLGQLAAEHKSISTEHKAITSSQKQLLLTSSHHCTDLTLCLVDDRYIALCKQLGHDSGMISARYPQNHDC